MPLKKHTIRARNLRRNATDAEHRLWWRLRQAALPWKFRRQHPVGQYVLDFAVVSHKLAIEIDGGQHHPHRDAVRSTSLNARGWQIIRFWNGEVLRDTDAVIEEIVQRLRERRPPTSPVPSPLSGRRGTKVRTQLVRGASEERR